MLQRRTHPTAQGPPPIPLGERLWVCVTLVAFVATLFVGPVHCLSIRVLEADHACSDGETHLAVHCDSEHDPQTCLICTQSLELTPRHTLAAARFSQSVVVATLLFPERVTVDRSSLFSFVSRGPPLT